MLWTVACVQFDPALGEVEANRARLESLLTAVIEGGADIVVLPELCITGYSLADAETARSLSEPADGPTARGWQKVIAGRAAVVIGGVLEAGGDGRLYNAAVVVNAEGCVGVYRKIHLWDREKLIFEEGAEPAPVIAHAGVRIGIEICHDIWYPEVARGLALRAADLIAVPTNWPRRPAPDGTPTNGVRLTEAAALVNHVYVAAADRTGAEDDVAFAGASLIADPDGRAIAGPLRGSPGTITAECALAAARDKAWGERNDVLADRRPDRY